MSCIETNYCTKSVWLPCKCVSHIHIYRLKPFPRRSYQIISLQINTKNYLREADCSVTNTPSANHDVVHTKNVNTFQELRYFVLQRTDPTAMCVTRWILLFTTYNCVNSKLHRHPVFSTSRFFNQLSHLSTNTYISLQYWILCTN